MTSRRRWKSKQKRQRRAERRRRASDAAEAAVNAEGEAEYRALQRGLPGLLVLALTTCAAIAWRGIHLKDWFAVLIVGTMACVTGFGAWRGLARGYFTERFGVKVRRTEDPSGFWFSVFILGLMHALCVWGLFTGTAKPYF